MSYDPRRLKIGIAWGCVFILCGVLFAVVLDWWLVATVGCLGGSLLVLVGMATLLRMRR